MSVLAGSLLGFAFTYAGIIKLLRGPSATYVTLATLGLDDPGVLHAIARGIPSFEIALGVWLLSGVGARRAGLVAIVAITGLTSALILIGLNTGWTAPCTCTGSITGESVLFALARNAVLLIAAIALAVGTVARKSALLTPRNAGTPVC